MADRKHKYFMDMALLTAAQSGDNSMGVGCVIVGPDNEVRSTGYNDFPRGVQERDERRQRPDKYVWTEHAERNAIYNAARVGVSLKDCRAYVACTDLKKGGYIPCAVCCRAFIQSGISEIVEFWTDPAEGPDRPWVQNLPIAQKMLSEAQVRLTLLDFETCEEMGFEIDGRQHFYPKWCPPPTR